MDPAKKESILGDLRMAKEATKIGAKKAALELMAIAIARMKEESP